MKMLSVLFLFIFLSWGWCAPMVSSCGSAGRFKKIVRTQFRERNFLIILEYLEYIRIFDEAVLHDNCSVVNDPKTIELKNNIDAKLANINCMIDKIKQLVLGCEFWKQMDLILCAASYHLSEKSKETEQFDKPFAEYNLITYTITEFRRYKDLLFPQYTYEELLECFFPFYPASVLRGYLREYGIMRSVKWKKPYDPADFDERMVLLKQTRKRKGFDLKEPERIKQKLFVEIPSSNASDGEEDDLLEPPELCFASELE